MATEKSTFRPMALAAFAAATVMWIIAGFWHNDLGPGVFNGVDAPLSAKSLGLTFLAYLIVTAVMARAYMLVAPERRTVMSAIRLGAYAGVLWTLPHALLSAAGQGDPLLPEVLHTLYHVIEEGIGGAVFGLAYQIGLRGRDAT